MAGCSGVHAIKRVAIVLFCVSFLSREELPPLISEGVHEKGAAPAHEQGSTLPFEELPIICVAVRTHRSPSLDGTLFVLKRV